MPLISFWGWIWVIWNRWPLPYWNLKVHKVNGGPKRKIGDLFHFVLKQLFGHRKGHWTWKMVTEFISPSFNTSRKILFHDSWGTIWPMCHDPTLLHMRHGMIDNLTQSKDFNQEWTSLRFKSVHPNYWIFFFLKLQLLNYWKREKKKAKLQIALSNFI